MNIGNNCTNLVVSDTSVTGRIPGGGQKPVAGPYPVLLTIDGTVYTGPDFTVT
jgi:hypothetical protein